MRKHNIILTIILALLSIATAWAEGESVTIQFKVSPEGAGSLSKNSVTIGENFSSTSVNTWAVSDKYVFVNWTDSQGNILSTSSWLSINKRPEHDDVYTANYAESGACCYFLEVIPEHAATLSKKEVYVKPNNTGKTGIYNYLAGYVFDHWEDESGNVVGTTEVIELPYTEGVDHHYKAICKYSPATPPTPDKAPKHRLTFECNRPDVAGSVRVRSDSYGLHDFQIGEILELNNGEKITWEYSISNYEYKFTDDRGYEYNKDKFKKYSYIMPDRDATINLTLNYIPPTPSVPNANYFDAATGTQYIDWFTPGQIQGAINECTWRTDESSVKTLVVRGKITDSDFIISNYSHLECADYSRTTGGTIAMGPFRKTVEKIILPASVDSIISTAFLEGYWGDKKDSHLRDLILYSKTPPRLQVTHSNNEYRTALSFVPDNCVIHVPALSVNKYLAAPYWSDFTIVPIDEDIVSVKVAFPEKTDLTAFRNMQLQLRNVKSGEGYSYVINDRKEYVFSEVINQSQYEVIVKNAQGKVFGSSGIIDIVTDDVAVMLSDITVPLTASVRVLLNGADKQADATSDVTIQWFDEAHNPLALGSTIGNLAPGSLLTAAVTLPESLAKEWQIPAEMQWNVAANDLKRDIIVNPLPVLTVSGQVLDSEHKLPVSGTAITASQNINGVFTSKKAVADAQGKFSLELHPADVVLSYNANDYASHADTLSVAADMALPTTLLSALNGARINLDMTITKAVASDAKAETETVRSADNIVVTLRNAADGKTFVGHKMQQTTVLMQENLADGTEVEVSVTSTDNAFLPASGTAIIKDNTATLTLKASQMGGISADFGKAYNSHVAAMLYNENGDMVRQGRFDNNAHINMSRLPSGKYTLVAMGECKLLNGCGAIDMLENIGLAEDRDYTAVRITVSDGNIAQVNIPEVPLIAENKFYYTDENTTVTLNKPSVSAGIRLVANCSVDFKPEYADHITDATAIFELPAGAVFGENTLIIDNVKKPYLIDGQKIIVSLEGNKAERLKFCFTPFEEGDNTLAAYVTFRLDGKEMTQPIGNPSCNVKLLQINADRNFADEDIIVSGMAPSFSDITVFVDGIENAHAKANGNGQWSVTAHIDNPLNLQRYAIYADALTKEGMTIKTNTLDCTYNSFRPRVKNVRMEHYNQWMRENVTVDFDLVNKVVTPNSYNFYKSAEFTFTVDLTDNSPETVQGVELFVYTSNQKWNEIETTYNAAIGKWVGKSTFDITCLPQGVKANVITNAGPVVSEECMTEAITQATDINKPSEEQKELRKLLEELEDTYTKSTAEEFDQYVRHRAMLLGIDFDEYTEAPTGDPIEALQQYGEEIDTWVQDYALDTSVLDNLDLSDVKQLAELSPDLSVSSAEGMTPEGLKELGYFCIETTGEPMYYLLNNTEYHIVSFRQNLHIITQLHSNNPIMAKLQRLTRADGSPEMSTEEYYAEIESFSQQVYSALSALSGAVATCVEKLQQANKAAGREWVLANKALEEAQKAGKNFLQTAFMRLKLGSIEDAIASNNKCLKYMKDNFLTKHAQVGSKMGKVFSVFDIANNLYSWHKDTKMLAEIFYSIPDPCEKNPAGAIVYQTGVLGTTAAAMTFYAANIAGSVASLAGISGGVAAVPVTGGLSLAVVAAAVGVAAINIGAGYAYSHNLTNITDELKYRIRRLRCTGNEPPCPVCGQLFCVCEPGGATADGSVTPRIDPSGFVYEGPESNRLENVTATCYYKGFREDEYGDMQEYVEIWNGEEFGEINPQLTDKMGMYHWDVPEGLWQVRLEKDGYQPTVSEWLPVPPPQLEVNLPLVQTTPPVVLDAHVYTSGAEVLFDKYMDAEWLTSETLQLSQDGSVIPANVTLIGAEPMGSNHDVTLSRKVRITPLTPYQDDKEVTLLVSRTVRSYAGIRMEGDFQQAFDVEKEVTAIEAETEINVNVDETKSITLQAVPAEAAAGKSLKATLHGNVAQLLNEDHSPFAGTAVLDGEGKAVICIKGIVPGSTAITYSVSDTGVEASTLVSVGTYNPLPPEEPQPSIASGSHVEVGTGIYLSCITPQSTIYYTLDGSCPCEATSSRHRYDGNPVIIAETTNLRAIAVSKDGVESEVASFYYVVETIGVEETLTQHQIDLRITPQHDQLMVTLPEGMSDCTLMVVGVDGKCYTSATSHHGRATIGVGHLPKGTYVVVAKGRGSRAFSL